MIKIQRTILVVLLSLLPWVAQAEGTGLILGAQYGMLDLDDSDISGGSFDGESTFSFSGAYAINAESAIEFRYLKGTVRLKEFTFNNEYDLDYTHTALYYTYRSTGSVYFLGRAGYGKTKATADSYGIRFSENEFTYGLGGGVRLSNTVSIEAEYTVLDDEASFFGAGIAIFL